ncbi:MAG TPA: PEPxxWA-CTERM sorting domain-containing protein [Phenylobacterium sp.]|jgi:hypothetical protein|uniref:PEPxxWA-CTERM sorting domain-containing protein n=1 Tax=Phenylobacterium sp. TaxID=1871053 RepID=UPI002C451C0A|nr:PEPxxWA-CTERM sorting domain-containing protein [Phenylobacterium sp.]HXA37895.1 PEPxxWA-CTERM sorting domain-containing protein [Phenylobacterium sp.]
MLRRLLTCAAAALAMSLGMTAAAGAAVINFDTHTTYTSAGTSFAEGGMTFQGYELYFVPPDSMMTTPSAFDSTITTPIMATWYEPLTMQLASGAAFDLQTISMGLGWYNLPGGDSETITGAKANCTDDGSGSCTVSDTFQVGYSFQTYSLTPDFTGLSSVTFGAMTTQITTDQDGAPFPYSGWIGYDNITFTSPGEVGEPAPEPAAWSLLILGFAAVGGLMRGRRRAPALARAA